MWIYAVKTQNMTPYVNELTVNWQMCKALQQNN